jgi:hypothetical protein
MLSSVLALTCLLLCGNAVVALAAVKGSVEPPLHQADSGCQVTDGAHIYDLGAIPTWKANSTINVSGVPALVYFVVSPCKAVSEPPSGTSACGSKAFVSYYLFDNRCEWFPTNVTKWSWAQGGATLTLSSMSTQTARLTLLCKRGIGHGLVKKELAYNAGFPVNDFHFEFYTEAVCPPEPRNSCSVTNNNGDTFDLSVIPTWKAKSTINVSGAADMQYFVVSPCKAVSEPPSGTSACSSEAFVSYYHLHDSPLSCDWYFPTNVTKWSWAHGGATLTLSSMSTETARLTLLCKRGIGNGLVKKELTYNAGFPVNEFHFEFYTEAVCGGSRH